MSILELAILFVVSWIIGAFIISGITGKVIKLRNERG